MTFARLVDDALACLAAEHPEAHQRMRAALAGRRLDVVVGKEALAVAPLDGSATSRIQIRTSVDTLSAVLFGQADVIEAVRSDRIEVVGSSEDLVALSDALMWFVEGAMRCVSIEGLVDRLTIMRGEDQHG